MTTETEKTKDAEFRDLAAMIRDLAEGRLKIDMLEAACAMLDERVDAALFKLSYSEAGKVREMVAELSTAIDIPPGVDHDEAQQVIVREASSPFLRRAINRTCCGLT
jgi:hypothetical protein